MWICKKCKEENEDTFDSCWNCQTISEKDLKKVSDIQIELKENDAKLVKCNHCGKETRNDNPLFVGKCTRCNKELDKNLEKIEQYQNLGKNNDSIKAIEDSKKLSESIKQYRKYNYILSNLTLIILAFFVKPPAIVYFVLLLIMIYIDIRFKKKRKIIMNRLIRGNEKQNEKNRKFKVE